MNSDVEQAQTLLEQLQAELEKVQELYDRYHAIDNDAPKDVEHHAEDSTADQSSSTDQPSSTDDPELSAQLQTALHEATSRCASLVDKLHAIVTTDGQLPLL